MLGVGRCARCRRRSLRRRFKNEYAHRSPTRRCLSAYETHCNDRSCCGGNRIVRLRERRTNILVVDSNDGDDRLPEVAGISISPERALRQSARSARSETGKLQRCCSCACPSTETPIPAITASLRRFANRGKESGRGDRIRTCDLLVPNQALYQAKLHPDFANDGGGTMRCVAAGASAFGHCLQRRLWS
jgi:hypothetical protein